MAGITALGTTYNLPNYTGLLYGLTPADTPFFSAAGGLNGGGQTTDVEFEWETYDLRSAGQNVALEGQTAPTPQERVRANASNILQIHQEAVGVSYTKQAATARLGGLASQGAANPVVNELDWQTRTMLSQMVRDVNWSFINGVYQKPSDNTTKRQTRGILAATTTNVLDAAGGVTATGTAAASTDLITLASHGLSIGDTIRFTSVGTATPLTTTSVYYVAASGFTTGVFKVTLTKGGAAVDITADGTVIWEKGVAVSVATVNTVAQMAYDNGGLTGGEPVMLVGSAQKLALSAAYTTANYVTKELAGNVGGVTVDRIQTDFGPMGIMLDRMMPQDTIEIVTMSQVRPVYLEVPGKGHFFEEPLAKTGASDSNQLYGEVGLDYGNQMMHAKITGLKA
jgi:hypothetical protein